MTTFDVLLQFDTPIEGALQQLSSHCQVLSGLMLTAQGLNLLKGLPFCAFFWALWLSSPPADANTARLTEVRQYVLRAVAGAILAIAIGRLMQTLLPGRLRPIHDASLGFIFPHGSQPEDTLSGWSSFPSDHAVVFASFATALWYRSRLLGVVSAFWTGLVVLFPRIYLGYHYPSDVIAGVLVGVVVMFAVLRVPLPRHLLEQPIAFVQRHARLSYGLAFLGLEQLGTNFDDLRNLAGYALGVIHRHL